jgi:hypothetical protein
LRESLRLERARNAPAGHLKVDALSRPQVDGCVGRQHAALREGALDRVAAAQRPRDEVGRGRARRIAPLNEAPVAVGVAAELPRIDEGADSFDDDRRRAAGLRHQPLGNGAPRFGGERQHRSEKRLDLDQLQRSESQLSQRTQIAQLVRAAELTAARRQQDEHARVARDAAGEREHESS